MKQQQFLNLATAEEAEERFWEAVQPQPLGEELVMQVFQLQNHLHCVMILQQFGLM